MKKIKAEALSNSWEKKPDFFIASVSFETRCLTIAQQISPHSGSIKSILFQSGESEAIQINKSTILTLLGKETISATLSLNDPVLTADAISNALEPLLSEQTGVLLIDITTFTHEQLLILIRYITFLKSTKKTAITVTIAYNGADKYSINTDEDNIWLSRGVREIRPILGFSGRFKSNQQTQLLLLVGFEHDRARAAIEHIEPSILTLGYGSKIESISDEFAETNNKFGKKLTEFIENISFTFSDVSSIEISLIDPIKTCEEILASINPDSYNVIVCPMNTKISTLGAALAALHEPRIQLIYVEPLEYNEAGYSTPDSYIRMGQLSI
jgi:hypothetical protein